MTQAGVKKMPLFSYSVFLYMIIILLSAWLIDFRLVAAQYSRYLGWRYAAGEFKNYRDGVLYYESLVSLYPHNAKIFADLGTLYYYLREYDDAVNAYQKAVRMEPHFMPFRQNLAMLYLLTGQNEKAASLLKSKIP